MVKNCVFGETHLSFSIGDSFQVFISKTVRSIGVQYGEVEVGKMIKAAGGRWNAQKKLWELAYKQVTALNLTDRIVEQA